MSNFFKHRSLVLALGFIAAAMQGLGQPGGPEFVTAEIQPSAKSMSSGHRNGPGNSRIFYFTGWTLANLTRLAFHLTPEQFVALPSMDGRFEGSFAYPPDAEPQFNTMLQDLLERRFRLQVHRVHKELDAFVVEVAEGGVKMDISEAKGVADSRVCERVPSTLGPDTMAQKCRGLDATDLSEFLFSGVFVYDQHRPILDRTALEGVYDFRLEYVPKSKADGGSPGPRFFEAAEKQLGLKITARKQMTEILVVDHVETVPRPN